MKKGHEVHKPLLSERHLNDPNQNCPRQEKYPCVEVESLRPFLMLQQLLQFENLSLTLDISDSSVGKESTCNEGDSGSILGLGRSPGEGNGLPTPVFLPGDFHGQKSLAGYSPWDHNESDMTK